MALFESLLTLLLLAVVLLQASRRLTIPYPTMLAAAGVGVAALPWAPNIAMDPRLVMALFIAPTLLDAAFDFPLRALRRYWMPLIALAVLAVIVTAAAVAWVGVAWAGLPVASAVALGAIVSPPDASAAAAMFTRLSLPRSTVTVLKGESLLNDATALLIFSAAVAAATGDGSTQLLPRLALAVPGGILCGIVLGKIVLAIAPHLAGTLGSILFQFAATFCIWLIADWLHLSPILAVVAAAMTLARSSSQPARDRVHSYSVWSAMVFVLNVLAFLLLGLEARAILTSLDAEQVRSALVFAALVLATVVVVRIVVVLLYNRLIQPVYRKLGRANPPSLAQGVVASWCGMRGMVTLATALALPPAFPGRDKIVLSALAVVLGTLIVQGITLGPLIKVLRFAPDTSYAHEMKTARLALLDVAIDQLKERDDDPGRLLRHTYETERACTVSGDLSQGTEIDALRRQSVAAQRKRLIELRQTGRIDDDVFHALEQELDLAELSASRADGFNLVED